MIIQKLNADDLKEWKWQSSPSSIRIEEKDPPYWLRYSISPPSQDLLVFVSYWIDDHNRMASMLEALEWIYDECMLCGGFKPKHNDWCSFK